MVAPVQAIFSYFWKSLASMSTRMFVCLFVFKYAGGLTDHTNFFYSFVWFFFVCLFFVCFFVFLFVFALFCFVLFFGHVHIDAKLPGLHFHYKRQ